MSARNSVSLYTHPGDVPAGLARVGVVEDDAAQRRALCDAIEAAADLALAFAAASRAEALLRLGETPADVLLVDLGLPDGDGQDVIAAASVQWPDCAVLVSTVFGDEASVLRAIEAGASGYLLKDMEAADVVREIRTVRAGGSPIHPLVARRILERIKVAAVAGKNRKARAAPPSIEMSPRERQVLDLIGRGFTAAEVAQILGLSKHTVLTFVRRIYKKLKVTSRAGALNMARRLGLLSI
jgi:DNA-binding NarL/FixJ family response regulator